VETEELFVKLNLNFIAIRPMQDASVKIESGAR